MKKNTWLIALCSWLLLLSGCAGKSKDVAFDAPKKPLMSGAAMSSYPTKPTPEAADRALITDNATGQTRNATLGALPVSTPVQTALNAKENSLGNPATTGWCLQSTTGGIRSWGVCGGLSSLPTGTGQSIVSTGVGTYAWESTVDLTVSAPLSLNTTTGALSFLSTGLSSGQTWVWNGSAFTAQSVGGGASSLSQLSDWPSTVSATEVGYLDGVTSNIQTQINALTSSSFSPTIQASTPSNSAATGPYINSSNNHFLYNISATGYYDLTAATYTAHTFDTTPSAFSFTDVADATLSTQYTALAQINGIDTGITCTGSGGTVAACTGATEGSCGAFGSTSGSITNNQYVGARVTSSGSNATAVNNTVTCGGVSDTYTVTTVAGASNPEFIQAKATYSKTNSITLDSAVTAGNQLIAVMLSTAGIPATISGGCATSWSSAVDFTPSAASVRARMYFCSNASAGSNAVTPGSWTTGDAGWHLMEVSNVGSYDTGQKNNYLTSTVFNSGNATASASTSLLVGAWEGSTTAAETWDSPWVSRSQLTGHRSATATRVVTSTGNFNASGTVATANNGAAFIMIFKKTGL